MWGVFTLRERLFYDKYSVYGSYDAQILFIRIYGIVRAILLLIFLKELRLLLLFLSFFLVFVNLLVLIFLVCLLQGLIQFFVRIGIENPLYYVFLRLSLQQIIGKPGMIALLIPQLPFLILFLGNYVFLWALGNQILKSQLL